MTILWRKNTWVFFPPSKKDFEETELPFLSTKYGESLTIVYGTQYTQQIDFLLKWRWKYQKRKKCNLNTFQQRSHNLIHAILTLQKLSGVKSIHVLKNFNICIYLLYRNSMKKNFHSQSYELKKKNQERGNFVMLCWFFSPLFHLTFMLMSRKWAMNCNNYVYIELI